MIRLPSTAIHPVTPLTGHDWIEQVNWYSSSQTFVVGPSRPLLEVSLVGTVLEPQQHYAFPFQEAPSGQWHWLSGPVSYSPFGADLSVAGRTGPPISVYDDYVCNILWDPDGTTIYFYSDEDDPILFRASEPQFDPAATARELSVSCSYTPQWIEPLRD